MVQLSRSPLFQLARLGTLTLLLAGACAAPFGQRGTAPSGLGIGVADGFDAPPLEGALSVRDGRSGATLSFAELVSKLARADVVFVGETHLDEATHRVEDALYEALLARRDGRVVLALEMFERDVQSALDAYLAGAYDEAEFLSATRPWSNYRSAYRRLIERARTAGAPVVASNFPAPLRRRIAMEGEAALASLATEERALVPAELLPNRPAYWRRVDNAVRGHLAMMGGPRDPGDPRLFDGQSLWDNAMGESAAKALATHPGHLVLHVNGAFHSRYWDGTVHQLRLRAPDAEILTVDVVPHSNPGAGRIGDVPVADFVVFAESRASDVRDGMYSVSTTRSLRYRLHLPDGASDAGRVPLFVWMGDEGATPDEGLALWRARLGEACAIAAVEAPYRALQDDLVLAGAWTFADTFDEDLPVLANGLSRLRGYLARNFPIDPDRIVLAGEGTGATAVVGASLLAGEFARAGFAFEPRRFTKLSDLPLPLVEFGGAEARATTPLRVQLGQAARESDIAWWRDELGQHVAAGLDSVLLEAPGDSWTLARARTNRVRAALGLTSLPDYPADAARRHLLATSAREARWARIRLETTAPETALAILAEAPQASTSQALALALDPTTLDADPPPRCPGPFGGTTVLVLSASTPEEELAAWRALEENDPLARSSRFHRLRIATREGDASLANVLERLLEEGRNNVLVVPAVFCADGDSMRALRASIGPLTDRLTVHWLPGLGAPAD